MTRAQTPSDIEKHKISRKSHRKSRNGCDNCKKRRIKCNEAWPRCSNCVKHDDRCSFSTQVRKPVSGSSGSGISGNGTSLSISDGLSNLGLSSQSTSPRDTFSTPRSIPSTTFDTPRSVPVVVEPLSTDDPRLQPVFTLVDMELYHNYQTATCYTLSGTPELQTFMRIEFPKIGFSNSFVLDCILAISALHLAHFKKDSREFYTMQAERHYEVALRTAVNLLPSINEHNCTALYVFASFCSSYTMAVGPKKGDFLLFSDTGIAEWRLLFTGVRTIIESHEWLIRGSQLTPMFEIAIRQISVSPSNNPHLRNLRDHIIATTPDECSLGIYLEALESLQKAFPMEPPEGSRGGPSTSQLVFTWLYRVTDDFVQSLQKREPIALVILGHFCVLLNDISSVWWINGWVDHLMSEIYGSLTGEHKMWMQWPIEQIGWIPS